jgi:hypothetical protein
MKTLTHFSAHTSLNSKPVMSAFLASASKHFKVVENDMSADCAVIWSCLWAGRMAPNKEIYKHFRSQGKPVIIIEVGALKRNITWKIAVNNITTAGYYGHLENLDWDRPRLLGIQLKEQTRNNGKILIAAQHHKSHQLANLESQEDWITQQIKTIQDQTDRDIVVRSHPRSPLSIPSQLPRKLEGTYDDFDFNTNYYCVVNYSSGPGIQAAIMGTPIITSEYSLAHPISNNINRLRRLRNKATEQWLTEIAHTEYLLEEIEQGRWISRLESQL